MTAEEVLNVSSKEIPDNNGEDHHKIITEHRNGDVKEISENGNVGGEVVSDSSTSDPIVTVDGNDAAVEDHKVEDESQRECQVVNDDNYNNIKENDSACETTTVDVVEKEGEICQNGSGSDVNDVHVSETVAEVGDEFASVPNGVSDKESNEIREGVKVDDDRELESVENGVVSENEICVAADVDKSDREYEGVENGAVDRDEEVKLESVDVQNGVVLENEICVDADVVRDEKEKEIEVPVVVEEEVTTAAAATDAVESVDSDAVEGSESKSKDHEVVESKNVDGVDVVSDEKNEIGGDAGLETEVVSEVSESAEKNEIAVDVDGVCDDEDVKECAVEDTQNGLENAAVESVSDTVVENGVAEVESVSDTVVENGVAEVEENVIPVDGSGQLEKSGEGSESQVLEDVDEGEHENKPSVEEESDVEPSDNAVKGEGESSIEVSEMKIDEVESEAEPSKEAVESVAEVSDNVVQIEADPSKEAVESVAEVLNNVVQSEADDSVDVPALKTEPVVIEAEPVVEAEPLVEAEPSVETEGEESKPSQETEAEDSKPSPEASATDAIDEQNMVTEVVRRPFYYLIRVPRYDDDENIKEQIQKALQQVEEKTKTRDEIRAESQTKKAICKEYGQEFRAAIQEERAARDLLKSKRQEMDSIQSIMNRLNNALSVGDIDGKIRNMEHMIQHETLPLKEEKQLIRQIKQLKQNRDELSTIIAKQDQSQSLDDKDSIEEHSKQLQLLKKELEVLRSNVLKTEAITKAAKKKYDEESNQLSEVLARFKAADDLRQEAYVKLQTLKRQLHEKSKYFWEYKNASTKGQELAIQGKKEELQSFCIDQAEQIMEMWNKNEEFRKNYIRCNTRSTLRRLQTFDGRSLGPDEEPPVIPNAFVERTSKNDSLVSRSIPEQQKKSTPTESINTKDEPASKVVVQKSEIDQTTKAKKPAKPAPSEKKSKAPVRRWGDESDEDTKEEPKEPVRTKEEEERILQAEKARKEEEEAKQKEMKRLEEIEKAKEALQRKKRNAEKAQQRAAFKAQKEAEQKEKEREKRARKKGKRKGVSTEDILDNTEQESAASPSSETLTRTTEVSDQSEKPVEVIKRPVKPSQFMKQNKVKSLPMAIRNRGKRRIQPWMWWALIAVLAVAALFYIGNNSSLRSSFQSYGF